MVSRLERIHDFGWASPMSIKFAIAAFVVSIMSPTLCSATDQWNWSLLPGDMTANGLYVDKSRLEKDGSAIEVWELLDSKKPLTEFMRSQNVIGVPYFSLVTLQKIDCAQRTIALLSWTEYMDHLGAGAVVATSVLAPKEIQSNAIVPGSIGDLVSRAVC